MDPLAFHLRVLRRLHYRFMLLKLTPYFWTAQLFHCPLNKRLANETFGCTRGFMGFSLDFWKPLAHLGE